MYDHWDVIVAGGGTAGMSTAILAAQRGARVLVIEHAQRLGGTLHMSSGRLSAAGTRLQAKGGFTTPHNLHCKTVIGIFRSEERRGGEGGYKLL
jgi:fumarate reductase flavoprotein subunit